MPSVSEPQAHLMAAVAHGWEPPGKHIPQSVGKEFHEADKKVGKWEHPDKSKQSSDHMNNYG
jgi:hypothetical protein